MIKINAYSFAQMVKLMLDGTYSCQELADLTGLHYVTVLGYTRAMYRAGAAHISSWEKDCRGRDVIKVYKIGAGVDAKRQKKTKAERSAAYRRKKRQLTQMRMLSHDTQRHQAHQS